MEPHGIGDEFEIDNLTIELPEGDDPARRQMMVQEVIQQLPGLLRRHTGNVDDQ